MVGRFWSVSWILVATTVLRGEPPRDRLQAVADTLAVQTAMHMAREHLLHDRPAEAVAVLEKHLSRIDGNAKYLTLLRDAYRAYIKRLHLKNDHAKARVYEEHLRILEGKAMPNEAKPLDSSLAPAELPPELLLGEGANRAADSNRRETASPQARAIVDPAIQQASFDQQEKESFLKRAEELFHKRQYLAAGQFYEKASQSGGALSQLDKERWAYCKMFRVVEVLNQAALDEATFLKLQQELNDVKKLAPRLTYADKVLAELKKRKKAAPIPVQHSGPDENGWLIAESENFVVYHNQPRDIAGMAARHAERTRTRMFKKWLDREPTPWKRKCEIYLHADAQAYSRATGVPQESPGHSSFYIDNGRILGRRIDLRCDNANLLIAVLPHETTHAVLTGNLDGDTPPRWADEGIAVLSEPRELIDGHLRKLPDLKRSGKLFRIGQLIEMPDYPDPRFIDAFYAQSVALVEFLVHKKGSREFTLFITDGLKGDFRSSLRKHYGYTDYQQLEAEWTRAYCGTP
ncbi:MAG: hypothetical protein KatS3mg105_4003 [Gemmatales bacterium]|nr:MAG: hypothetical protein KatS3mg105_4003 [Gemmatales bacterium]